MTNVLNFSDLSLIFLDTSYIINAEKQQFFVLIEMIKSFFSFPFFGLVRKNYTVPLRCGCKVLFSLDGEGSINRQMHFLHTLNKNS